MTTVITINGPIDIEITNVSDLAGMDIWGAQTATSFGLQVVGDWAMAFGGTGFGSYSGNRPTTGTITSIEQWGLGGGSPIQRSAWTGISLSVTDFNAWIATNDVVAMQNAIFGGADTVTGSAFADNLFTYGGDDTITPGGGGDIVNAGAGADIVRSAGMIMSDSYEGGDGADTLSVLDGVETNVFGSYYAFVSDYTFGDLNSFEALTFAENTASDRIAMFTTLQAATDLASTLQITGGAGVDIVGVFGEGTVDLSGWQFTNWTPFSVTFDANGDLVFDNDIVLISTGAGNDVLTGTSQGDMLQAGAGDDVLQGGGGNDQLDGWEGVDFLYGGDGDDALVFSEGDISSGEIADGGAGTDTLGIYGTVDARNISLTSLEALRFLGQEAASGVTFNASQFGGGLANSLAVTGSASLADEVNVYMTTAGAFSAAGWTFSNWSSADLVRIFGSAGDDIISVTALNDYVDGGSGNDDVSYVAATSAVTVNLQLLGAQDTGGGGVDTLISIERLEGSNFDDVLIGDANNNILSGNAGNDTLEGGAGDDVLNGTTGFDIASYASAGAGVSVSLALMGEAQNTIGAGVDVLHNIDGLWGSAFDDALTGDAAVNALVGHGGDDTLDGGDGNDELYGGAGNDTLLGGAGNDYLNDDSGTDFVSGGDGNDDVIIGQFSIQNDTFDGGAGQDTLLLSTSGIYADFQGTTLNSIEGVAFDRIGGGWAIFSTAQIGSGLSASALIDGSFGQDHIVLHLSAPGAFSVGFSFTDWNSSEGDVVEVYGTSSADAITGSAYRDFLSGGDGNDTLEGGAGDDVLAGGSGTDRLTYVSATSGVTVSLALQGAAQDTLGAGLDTLSSIEEIFGSLHADVLTGDGGDNFLAGNSGNDTLIGGDGNDLLSGEGDSDQVDGGAGNDTLYGGSGADNVSGGEGDDIFAVGSGDIVAGDVLNGGDGSDTLLLSSQNISTDFRSTTLSSFEGLTFDRTGSNQATFSTSQLGAGLSASAVIDGNSGTDRVVLYMSASGSFTVNFTFVDWSASDQIFVYGTGSADAITGSSYVDYLDGSNGDDVLQGLGGDDTLIGGLGADTMSGGDGNDTYLVDSAGDVVTEILGQGTDTVQASITYTLGAEVENLTLTGAGSISGAGNALANTLVGNSGSNVLDGAAGADILNGNDGADVLNGGAGNDTLDGGNHDDQLFGGDNADTLYGRAGNDTLDGGAGSNTLEGGAGDDIYIVRSAADVISEVAASGTDLVISTATRTLGNFLENLTLTGEAAINGFGNILGNVMIGNEAANTLNGVAGADTLSGNGGTDTLNGGDGNDILNGGADNDLLDGGNNDDTLNGGDGADTLYGRTQNDTLNGDAGADTLIGGDGDDVINGGADNDLIDGLNHNDTLSGGDGADEIYGRQNNDTLNGDAGADTLYGGDGDDVLNGGADDDFLDGSNGVDVLNGGDGADTLYGRNGNDTLDGGLGADTLYGGNDADTFVFSTALGGGNIDVLGAFSVLDDTIQLSLSIFSAFGATLDAGEFVIGSAAADADDFIIYDAATGALYYDADGNGGGAAVQFATLGVGLALTAADFVGGP